MRSIATKEGLQGVLGVRLKPKDTVVNILVVDDSKLCLLPVKMVVQELALVHFCPMGLI